MEESDMIGWISRRRLSSSNAIKIILILTIFINVDKQIIWQTITAKLNRPWWPSGLEHVSNSSRHSLKDPGSNPEYGNNIDRPVRNDLLLIHNMLGHRVVYDCFHTGNRRIWWHEYVPEQVIKSVNQIKWVNNLQRINRVMLYIMNRSLCIIMS